MQPLARLLHLRDGLGLLDTQLLALGLERALALQQMLAPGLEAAEFGPERRTFALAGGQFALDRVARLLDLGTRGTQLLLPVQQFGLASQEILDLGPHLLDRLRTLEHAPGRRAGRRRQPVRSDLDAFAGDPALVGRQRRAPGQRIGQRVGDTRTAQQMDERPGRSSTLRQTVRAGTGDGHGDRRIGIEQHQTGRQIVPRTDMGLESRRSHGAQGITEQRLDRPLPPRLDRQSIDQTRSIRESPSLQPGRAIAVRIGQRRVLQRGQGGQTPLGFLELGAHPGQLVGLTAQSFVHRGQLGALAPTILRECVDTFGQDGFALAELLDPPGHAIGIETTQFLLETTQPLVIAPHGLLEGIDACALDLGLLGRFGGGLIEAVPVGLPGLETILQGHEGTRRIAEFGLGLLQFGLVTLKLLVDLGQALAVALQIGVGLVEFLLQPNQLGLAPAALLVGELDRLLGAGDLGADGIEAALDLVEEVGGRAQIGAACLDVGLQTTLTRQSGLGRDLGLAETAVHALDLFVEQAPAQGLQLLVETALVRLELGVFLGRRRLAFEMLQLLADLLAQVVEPVQVLARMAHPVLGFATAFLVFGDARRLLQEETQILGPGLDDARDRALLDDGV
ncbi:hypothetical protein D779_0456 [Imhoffiella purpurea]|uniref:Uncharacterized protein n=1 Tax=Imhoffiella purpurea TaxID=1249627 RepID=W9VA66_9GAMM|nr:hypothetical protein D779_0456 [Imhoffiella purpurea]